VKRPPPVAFAIDSARISAWFADAALERAQEIHPVDSALMDLLRLCERERAARLAVVAWHGESIADALQRVCGGTS
jgi:hypothetical protein